MNIMGKINVGSITGNSGIINIGSGNVIVPDPSLPALHQLPDPPADFVGRVVELEDLVNAAQSMNILIHGLGGIGKTALGLVLAHQLKVRYPDGQLYLHLRGASNNPVTPAAALEQLIRSFAPVARLPEDVEQLANIYRTLLADKHILVLLDDARDAAQVRALLPPRPALAIVTSRGRFDLAGYHTCDVSALPLEDAVKLICAVWGQTGEVTALAARCGRLPMALRAAGALLRRRPDLTPAGVDALLTDTARRLALADPERDNLTVAAAFQASYDQLTADLQARWRALGVFPADFDAAAAAAVWGDAADPGETLADLHAAGLVDFVTGVRWRLHDLARDFTCSLCASAEMDALAYRHAAYYLDVLAEANAWYLKGSEHILAGLVLFDRERMNIEAGQAWAAACSTGPITATLCNAYPDAGAYVLPLRLHPRAQIAWLEAALTAARALGNREYEGFHLGNLGNRYRELGEPHRAIEYHQQRLVIAREIGDRHGEGNALGNLGLAWDDLGEPHRAIDYYEQALVIAREIGDRRSEGQTLGNLGSAWDGLGKLYRAIDYYEQALVIAREIGDRCGEGNALGNLGNAWADLNDSRRAIDYFEQDLVITREIGDRRGEGQDLGNLGNAWFALNNPSRAIEYHEQALVIDREIGDRRGEGQDLGNLGNAWAALNDPCRAIDYYGQALALAQAIGDRQGEANRCWNLGLLLEQQGELTRAIELMQVQVDFLRAIGHPDAEEADAYVQEIRQRL